MGTPHFFAVSTAFQRTLPSASPSALSHACAASGYLIAPRISMAWPRTTRSGSESAATRSGSAGRPAARTDAQSCRAMERAASCSGRSGFQPRLSRDLAAPKRMYLSGWVRQPVRGPMLRRSPACPSVIAAAQRTSGSGSFSSIFITAAVQPGSLLLAKASRAPIRTVTEGTSRLFIRAGVAAGPQEARATTAISCTAGSRWLRSSASSE
jgi:hypothetical protein